MTYTSGRPEWHGHRLTSPNNGQPVYPVYADPDRPPAAPVFPVGAMPRPCRELINQSAASIGCPRDFVGVGMLPTLGSAIGNARTVELKLGWEESPALYAVTIAEPGEKKSPAAKIAAAPAIRAQASFRRKYRRKADEHKKLMRRYEVERKEAAKNGTPAGPPPEEPRMERALVEDTTVEALAVVLEGTHSAVQALLRHQELQDAERSRSNGSWRDYGLVFPNTLGGYADYTNLMPRHFKPLLKKAGLPNIRFHDLRHTCATLLFTRGVHPKIVSEMLGHSSVSITLDVYSHVIPGLGDAAALSMEDALGDDPGVGGVGGEEPK